MSSAFNVNDQLLSSGPALIGRELLGTKEKICRRGSLQAKQQLHDHKRFLIDRERERKKPLVSRPMII